MSALEHIRLSLAGGIFGMSFCGVAFAVSPSVCVLTAGPLIVLTSIIVAAIGADQ